MVFGRFEAKHKKQEKYCLPRRDVTTSQRRDAWSTEASQQATQSHDVTMISAPASLNARGDLILGVSKNVRIKGRKVEQ